MSQSTTFVPRALLDPPGGVLMWIVVAIELFAFAMVFVLIASLRLGDPAAFRVEQAALDPALGLKLTLLLVTSGWFAAEAVQAFRASRIEHARRWYLAAVITGVGSPVITAHCRGGGGGQRVSGSRR